MKKAQIKLFETIAILTVFFFLLVFGLSFYASVQQKSFAQEQKKNTELAAVKLAQKAASMAELQCSTKNIPVDNCFDVLKINSFNKLLGEEVGLSDFYFDIFGFSDIKIQMIFPNNAEYVVYSNPAKEFDTKLQTRIPISIYNATSRRFGFGLLMIDAYD